MLLPLDLFDMQRKDVTIREIFSSDAFLKSTLHVPVAFGIVPEKTPVLMDLSKMHHLLIAGRSTTGIKDLYHLIMMSLLYRFPSEQVKLVIFDATYDLSLYKEIPHLLRPVINDPQKALRFLCNLLFVEMQKRYTVIAEKSTRDINVFNGKISETENLPYLVILLPEIEKVMKMMSKGDAIILSQLIVLGRAAGIYMIMASEDLNRDTFTWFLKQITYRIAFRVSTSEESRMILDRSGAEDLRDDREMIMSLPGKKFQRLLIPIISEEEIHRVVHYARINVRRN